MNPPDLSRRALLALGAAAGVSATFMGYGAEAASADFAARKLVVIICRGAMDGLSVTPPIGDADYAALRGPIAIAPDQAIRVDATFALHPKLAHFDQLRQAGQARFAPAVAIPERIRSHFEAQDMLESGAGAMYGASTGWLNRTLQALAPTRPIKALAVGAQEPLILRGPIEADSWSPGGRVDPTARIAQTLTDLYRGDPLLGPALAAGLRTEAQAATLNNGQLPKGGDVQAFAATAARFLAAPDGPSIAVLSLDGYDTHANQGAAQGQLANRLGVLDAVIKGLHDGMGDQWRNTVVIAATEFGRTARVNGTGGTDHGTASTLLLAGGALKGGGIVGDWPTLADGKLFEDRDLAPTLDVRQVFKGVLIEHLGVDGRRLETVVFPNSRTAQPVRGLIA